MTRRGLYSSDYSDEARERLGAAVEAKRRSLGYETRRQFWIASKISVRSIEKIELGEKGVGPLIFDRLQRALPGWTTNTIRRILDGEAPPAKPMDVVWPDRINELLESAPEAPTVLERLTRLLQDLLDEGLTGDDLLALLREALRNR